MIDFEQLEEDLRAERVAMDPRKKEELRRSLRAPAPTPRRSFRWAFAPAAGLACAALIALVLVFGSDGADEEGSGGSSGPVAMSQESAPELDAAAAPPADSADSAVGGSVAPQPAPLPERATPSAPPGGRRFVERTTSLTLKTPADGLQDAANGVVRETKAAGGVVDSSSVSATDDGGTATFALRIPAEKLAGAIEQLSELGDVTSLDEATQDITGSVASASERLSEARAERRGILRSLQRADSETELRALRQRLAEVRRRIGRADGDLRAVRRRADLASVSVSLTAAGEAREGDGAGVWTPGDAAGDAWRVLQVLAGVALVAAAVLVPAALLTWAAAASARGLRRRRREHALDTV